MLQALIELRSQGRDDAAGLECDRPRTFGRTTKNTVANLVSIVQELCAEDVEPDGMRFDPATAGGSVINEDAEYNGIRVKFMGLLGVSRASMQIDVGFGDEVVPSPVEIEVPALLDFPAPKLRGYQRDTAIAEKFHAMVVLGTANTRMKDFYDLWLLAENFDFDGAQLASAIKATFAARTETLDVEPIALTPAFSESDAAQARWTSFLKKSTLSDVPDSLAAVVMVLREFLLPVLRARGPARWPKGGPWQK